MDIDHALSVLNTAIRSNEMQPRTRDAIRVDDLLTSLYSTVHEAKENFPKLNERIKGLEDCLKLERAKNKQQQELIVEIQTKHRIVVQNLELQIDTLKGALDSYVRQIATLEEEYKKIWVIAKQSLYILRVFQMFVLRIFAGLPQNIVNRLSDGNFFPLLKFLSFNKETDVHGIGKKSRSLIMQAQKCFAR